MKQVRQKRKRKTAVKTALMFIVAILWVLPFIYPILISVKPGNEVFSDLLGLPSRLDFSNYVVAWTKGNMGRALLNTAIITVSTVLILVIFGSLCAYTIARRRGWIWNALYLFFVVGTILPYKLGLLPTYVAFNKAGLTGTFPGIILLQAGIQMPMTVFLFTGFIRATPTMYEEAAQIDGASPLQTFAHVIFPLLAPVTATVVIQNGISVWNDFFLSLIFLGGSKRLPLSVTLYSYIGDNATQWNLVFASVILSLIPVVILFLLLQENMMKGFAGGIKG